MSRAKTSPLAGWKGLTSGGKRSFSSSALSWRELGGRTGLQDQDTGCMNIAGNPCFRKRSIRG